VHEEDQRLVAEAQQGNLSAFGRLYEIYFERVYRYMMARVGDASEAEDLTQELFLKVMASLGSYRFQGPPFAAWLFRIARNTVVDRARRRKTAGPSVPLEEASFVPAGGSVEEEALRTLSRETLVAALGRVTDLQRQVVELRFMADLSISETAAVMKRNDNAVKALQHSALQALRRVLSQTPEDAPKGMR
jgi:RNA polymerase sigma-70 factor (ECF subfamily)